eukprot:TRINITY_DN1464_c0_g1_i2.p1 TRINITY_DN1464_c0_g1~~TRINITY_DN1464_c0_g1_i2.p1  ORF type:complete len:421 (-),score=58.37 TRINITY_DN1464_c0_g1_i2:75-1262(-)
MNIHIFLIFVSLCFGLSGSTELVVDFEFQNLAPVCCGLPDPVCGDGVCESPREGCDEARFPCRYDCDCGDFCGDTVCQMSEDCSSCPNDCGVCSVCGNDNCEINGIPPESCHSCDLDCGICIICGDGECHPSEDCNSCGDDCGPCPIGTVQGRIVDSVFGFPLPGATAQLIINGKGYATLQTDRDGYFMYYAAPSPSCTFKFTYPGYYDAYTTLQTPPGNLTRFVRGMSPLLQPRQWRFILTWLEEPEDMDLTLFGPWDPNYYTNGVCNWETRIKNASLPWAGLSPADDVLSYGPESLLLLEVPGNYPPLEIWLHNYSGDRIDPSREFRNSTANIWAFNYLGQQGEWYLSADAPLGSKWWHILNLRSGAFIDTIDEFYNSTAADCNYVYCPYTPQ